MANSLKRTIAFIFFMLAGSVVGAFISYICEGKKWVGWLAWGKEIGISTVNVDLIILKFPFGLVIDVTIAQIITIAAAIYLFAKTCKSL